MSQKSFSPVARADTAGPSRQSSKRSAISGARPANSIPAHQPAQQTNPVQHRRVGVELFQLLNPLRDNVTEHVFRTASKDG